MKEQEGSQSRITLKYEICLFLIIFYIYLNFLVYLFFNIYKQCIKTLLEWPMTFDHQVLQGYFIFTLFCAYSLYHCQYD